MALPIRLDALGEKVGPLPLWAWVGIATAGGVVAVKLLGGHKAPKLAATAPQGPEMPFADQGVPGAVDSSYGGSGSYTTAQTYVCPSGTIVFDPSQCAPSSPPSSPPPSQPPGGGGTCDQQFPLVRFPVGSKGGSWSGARPVGYWRCLVDKGCTDGDSGTLPYCGLFQRGPGYTVKALDASGNLVDWRPSGSNNGDASPRIQADAVSALYSGASEMPLPGYRYALPASNPRGTGI